jgi:2-polyprenyl-6-methoxyphenol hydroxylase-like FAD-dependent oxidoreductase
MSRHGRVVIIGGGIAGKLAARVLADFFQDVIILERDQEPEGPSPRKGAPQGKHLHALLLAGQNGLEVLFPGISNKFHLSGAVKINSTQELSWFHHGEWKLRFDGPYRTTLQTRPHLEWHIEQAIKAIPNVVVQYNQVVENFLFNENDNRIFGVGLADGSILTADLIIDASGVSNLSINWLTKRGIHIPVEKIKIGLSYFTKTFLLPDRKERDWSIKIVYPNPPQEKMGGTISKVEGNRYMVTINGYHDVINEKDVLNNETGFIELAKKIPKLDIYEDIKDASPLSNTSIYRVPNITWKRLDKVRNLPDGLLLIGDTICRIDPVFGQGMSIAVLEALALQKLFQKHNDLQQITESFHKKAGKIISPIWSMVITEDFRYPETAGKKPFGLSIQQWYAKSLFLLSAENQLIYDSFVKVMNLVSPMTILMQPKIIKSVLKRTFFK